ncbi:MAG: cytochrome b N-terminal domain-containing protein, partial [Candidatus Eremiobacteraeota bacterium]|nr:cytochrome b N-terminal domain-containing protein [Candidatus Eremiobacteraeota bacterium]
VEERTGIVSATKTFLTEDVPGGASYWYVFGSATLIVFIIQILTGIFLTFYYAPSATTAWESTKFIYDKVLLGQFIISLHSWGASAMIVLMTMHLLQVLLWGAYKRPREVQWIVGVLLFIFTLTMGLTGYLLPWDLNAYFASQVAINIASSVPIVGTATANFLQDGSTMGTLTINRFFGLHVWLTPILLLLLVGAHLAIFRHNGSAGQPKDEAPVKYGRFYPNQLFMDTLSSVIVFLIIVALSIWSPTPLLAKADPNNSQFIPSPAWYFYALYGILRIAPPSMEVVATVVVPGLLVLVLILLPWIDRNPRRALKRRPYLVGLTILSVAATVGISILASRAIADEQAASGFAGQTPVAGAGSSSGVNGQNAAVGKLAGNGTNVGAATAVRGANGGPAVSGQTVYATNCASCHNANGQGLPGTFPPLAGNTFVTGDAGKVINVLQHGLVGAINVNGKQFNGAMPAWQSKLSPAEIAAVITYIRSTWGNKAAPVTEAQVRAHK